MSESMWLWGALVAGVLIAFLYALKIFFTPKPRNQANISVILVHITGF